MSKRSRLFSWNRPPGLLSKFLQTQKIDRAHYCPEWDYTWIEPGDPEFEVCTCKESVSD